jgi:hypothetical protein
VIETYYLTCLWLASLAEAGGRYRQAEHWLTCAFEAWMPWGAADA